MQVDLSDPAAVVWRPDAAMVEGANLTRFMRALGVESFEALNAHASQDPAGFHDALIRFLDYRFERPYERVLDLGDGLPFAHWCVGGVTNVVLNCVDRWRGTARYEQPALVWEGEDGAVTTWTFADLDRETCRLAWGLRRLGLGRGDVVGMYLPNLPHAAAAMLAVAKIGAIVLPMFSGFGADAIAQRLNDGRAKALITVDGSLRRGKPVGAKAVVDEALAQCPGVRHVVVLNHLATRHGWKEGRDHWWHELTAGAPDDVAAVPTEPMPADDPFLLMFTSGTSGKPKGVVHSHCGFPVKTALDLSICMDLKPDDRFLWMSDMGWLVGPLLVFGGLLVGCTVVLAEGAPNYPEPDRLWRLVERHRVSYLGLAPTVARLSMSLPDETLAERDLSSLRVMISTGEPWTPEAWHWTFERIGQRRVPLLNYSGGTEMGGILTGTVIHPLKPCAFAGPVPGTGADVVDAEGASVGCRRHGRAGDAHAHHRPHARAVARPRALSAKLLVAPAGPVGARRLRQPRCRRHVVRARALRRHAQDRRQAHGAFRDRGAADGHRPAARRRRDRHSRPHQGHRGGLRLRAHGRTPIRRPRSKALSAAIIAGLGGAFKPAAVVFVADLPRTRNMKVMRRVVRAAWLGEEPGDLSTLVNPESVQAIGAARPR